MPISVVSVEQAPEALRPASTASAQIGRTIRARCSGEQSAVAWLKLGDGLGRQRVRQVRQVRVFGLALAPPATARSTTCASADVGRDRWWWRRPTRLPTIARTRTWTLRSATFWWMPELAKRVSAESTPMTTTSVWSAVDAASTRSASASKRALPK